jgi:hypothetical protein
MGRNKGVFYLIILGLPAFAAPRGRGGGEAGPWGLLVFHITVIVFHNMNGIAEEGEINFNGDVTSNSPARLFPSRYGYTVYCIP